MHISDLANEATAYLPLLAILGSGLGWLINTLLIKRARKLIAKIHSAHARIDEVDASVKEIKIDLSHFMENIQQNVTDKIASIQTTMSTQFERMSNSIEKIYVLMIKRKDGEH